MWYQAFIPELAAVLVSKPAATIWPAPIARPPGVREVTYQLIGQLLPGGSHNVVHSQYQSKLTTGVRDGY
jgi:hypothetical protein